MEREPNNRLAFCYEEFFSDRILSYLRGNCIRFSWQVPALGGRIDFVGIGPSYEVIAIEAKTFKWREALKQACRYMLCCDRAYVAVSERVAQTAVIHADMFEKKGVGLMAVGNGVRILIRARKSWLKLESLRTHLIKTTARRRRQSSDSVSQLISDFATDLGVDYEKTRTDVSLRVHQ